MSTTNIALIGGTLTALGVFLSAVYAIVKLGAEKASIDIQNVDRLVSVETGFSDRTLKRLEAAEERIGKLTRSMESLRSELADVTRERDSLRDRVEHLEDENRRLEQRVADLDRGPGPVGPPGAPGTQGAQGPSGAQGIQGERGST